MHLDFIGYNADIFIKYISHIITLLKPFTFVCFLVEYFLKKIINSNYFVLLQSYQETGVNKKSAPQNSCISKKKLLQVLNTLIKCYLPKIVQ